MKSTETLIVGGGLAGLALAERLQVAGRSFELVEARPRLGGRILTETVGTGTFDLGPAWFWPGQPRVEALVRRFGLEHFEQYATGDFVYEDEHGQRQRGSGYAPMRGALRIAGGLAALIGALAEAVDPLRIGLSSPVTQLARTAGGVVATVPNDRIEAETVVLAIPPRLAARIGFTPELSSATIAAMQAIPTWMAGQAKALAVYDQPFWRQAGLSGDAMSQRGPMVEIHDASALGGPYALFGFIGLPPHARANGSLLRQQLLAQLVALFGQAAEEHVELLVKDWASDPETATAADHRSPQHHPVYGLPQALRGLWDDRLLFGGTEVADEFGGFIEGALEAAEAALARLDPVTTQKL